MVADGTMFNGNCNLDLSGACTFSSATDFWRPMPNANQILFITGDRQYWGHAWYADIWSIIQAATAEQFSTNLTWINAGRLGASVGSIQGNVLFREGRFPETGNPFTEDPWVTLEGPHCAPYINTVASCSEMLWGENAFPLDQHATLMMDHGGIEVWAREYDASSIVTPEPSTYALMATGLLGLGVANRRRRKSPAA